MLHSPTGNPADQLAEALRLSVPQQVRLLRSLVGTFPEPSKWACAAQTTRDKDHEDADALAPELAARFEPEPETPLTELVRRRYLSATALRRLDALDVRTLADLRRVTWGSLHDIPYMKAWAVSLAAWGLAAGIVIPDPDTEADRERHTS